MAGEHSPVKSKSISIRLPEQLHSELTELSEAKGFKLATYIRHTMGEHSIEKREHPSEHSSKNAENGTLNGESIQWYQEKIDTLQQLLDQEQQLHLLALEDHRRQLGEPIWRRWGRSLGLISN